MLTKFYLLIVFREQVFFPLRGRDWIHLVENLVELVVVDHSDVRPGGIGEVAREKVLFRPAPVDVLGVIGGLRHRCGVPKITHLRLEQHQT